jgi:23S rRNA (guanosine2251-2'-O)-methyltransferase
MYDQDMTGAFALVIGNEGEGLARLVRERCDYLVSIPMNGHVDSLNAGVAAGILLFEKRRQEQVKA